MAFANKSRETQDMLNHIRTLMRYDPDTGQLRRLRDDAILGSNGKYKDTDKPDYKQVGVTYNGHYYNFAAHRICWALYHNAWPEHTIDHDNAIRNDNRIDNLKVMTHSENVSKALKTRVRTPETIAKFVAKTTGKKRTSEQCERIGSSKRGTKRDPVIVAAVAEKTRGQKRSPESIQRYKDAWALRKANKQISTT
jgi:hypothetical protein